MTTIEPFRAFYPAEGYHQDFATLHPDDGYIAANDLPKIEALRQFFPALYRPHAKLVGATRLGIVAIAVKAGLDPAIHALCVTDCEARTAVVNVCADGRVKPAP